MSVMKTAATALFLALLSASAAGQDVMEPFKVGTFEIEGEPRVALVLRDILVVDLKGANAVLERGGMYPNVPMPGDMIELIERYAYGLKRRLYELTNDIVGNERFRRRGRPDYIYDLDDVRTLPPIMYPGKILNAAVNPDFSSCLGRPIPPFCRDRYPGESAPG